jgi:hypothetical protein
MTEFIMRLFPFLPLAILAIAYLYKILIKPYIAKKYINKYIKITKYKFKSSFIIKGAPIQPNKGIPHPTVQGLYVDRELYAKIIDYIPSTETTSGKFVLYTDLGYSELNFKQKKFHESHVINWKLKFTTDCKEISKEEFELAIQRNQLDKIK